MPLSPWSRLVQGVASWNTLAFYKPIVFAVETVYSNFLPISGWKYPCEHSKTIAYDISVFEYIPAVSLWRLRNFEASLQAFKLDMTNITSFTNVFSIEQHAASVIVGFGKFCRLERGFVKNL